ncbi:MAG: RNase adapter RapZ [Elusimicrobiota bacterium]
MNRCKEKEPDIVIITGISGAGKSVAIKSIEDFGGFCVDNMPAALVLKFVKLIKSSNYSESIIALGIDVRSEGFMEDIFKILSRTEELGYNNEIIFMEASEDTIIRRYNESRRRHPLDKGKGRLKDALKEEKKKLSRLRKEADYIIDTSNLSPHQLKHKLKEIIVEEKEHSVQINLVAFGFKYGIPTDIDMLIDTRLLPNPHYKATLSDLTGNDEKIRDFILKKDLSKQFIDKYKDLLNFIVPRYVKEGKTYINIGIGCTGGRHRSVVVAGELAKFLKSKDYKVYKTDRDIGE